MNATNPQPAKGPAMDLPTAVQALANVMAAEPAMDLKATPSAIQPNGGEFSGGPATYKEKPIWIGAPDAPQTLPEGAVHTAARRGPPPLKLLAKLAAIMADLNWVEKRGRNSHFNYDYATESDILGAIRPRLAEAGIFVHTLIEAETATPTGKTTREGAPIMLHRVQLLHIFNDSDSGETLEGVGIGYSNDDSDKGFYKAYTGAVKYFFTKTFLVSSGDDPENQNPEEREAAKKAKKAQQAETTQRGPQQTAGSVQTDENGVFPVVSLVDVFTTKNLSGGRTQWAFQIPNVGRASTINKALAEKLIKEKGSGMPIRFYLKRAGSFLNLENAEVLPPGSMS